MKEKKLFDNLDLVETLAKRFSSYYTGDVTSSKILTFLYQFDEPDIDGVLKLLTNINFLSKNKLHHLIKKCLDFCQLDNDENYIISALGDLHDSSSLFTYEIFKEKFSDESETLKHIFNASDLGKVLVENKPKKVAFFDDNITSGTQVYQFFTELILGAERPEMVKTVLSKDQLTILQKSTIYLCYAIELSEQAQQTVDKIKAEFDVEIKLVSAIKDYNNYLSYESPFIETKKESQNLRKCIRKISRSLYKDREWNTNTVYDRLEGYGNLGKLTVFNHNIPKSLVPIFWKTGKYNNKMWYPLFPERSEVKKIEKIDFTNQKISKEYLKSIILGKSFKSTYQEDTLKEKIDQLNYRELISSGSSIIIKAGNLHLAILQMRPFTSIEKNIAVGQIISKSEEIKIEVFNFKDDIYEQEYIDILEAEKINRFEQYNYFLSKEGIAVNGLNIGFLNDADLKGEYNLYVIYTKDQFDKLKVLYSVRSFQDEIDITNEIVSSIKPADTDLSFESKLSVAQMMNSTAVLDNDLEKYFVMDRLAGRSSSSFQLLKFLAFRVAYSFNLALGKNIMIGLARRNTRERLLYQYFNLGFEFIGIAYYNLGTEDPIPHWVISTNIENISMLNRQYYFFSTLMEPLKNKIARDNNIYHAIG